MLLKSSLGSRFPVPSIDLEELVELNYLIRCSLDLFFSGLLIYVAVVGSRLNHNRSTSF